MAYPSPRSLAVATLIGAAVFVSSVHAESNDWAMPENPYRVALQLDEPLSSPAALDLDVQPIIDAVAAVAVDQVNHDTFAFERAVLVNPETGATVGRFELMREDQPLEIDGSFDGLREGKSPWYGFMKDKMRFKAVRLGGERKIALMIEEEKVINAKMQQTVQLTPGQRYLLEYWIMMDPTDNSMGVMINDPDLVLFAQLPHSYFKRLPPAGKWVQQRVIFRPRVEKAQIELRPTPEDAWLQVTHAFVGEGGVADIRLQPAAWRLVVEPDQPLEKLDLYVMARAGHRFTAMNEGLIGENPPRDRVAASVGSAVSQPLNPDGVLVSSGDAEGGIAAWTVAPALPMKVGALEKYKPTSNASGRAEAARIDVFPGGSASLVIAVDADRPRLADVKASADLPADVKFHRLATVPVYDGATVDGKIMGDLIETRYDPMVALDYELDPDSTDGMHLIVATIRPTDDTPAGAHEGSVSLTIGDQSLAVPVALHVSANKIAPMEHFGSLFGATFFTIANKAGVAAMVKDTVSIASYHGMGDADLTPPTILSLSVPDAVPDDRMISVRELAEKYFHVMLDNHLIPQSPALYAHFSYDIEERGEGLAPKLSNWDFTGGFDKAIDEFVVGRDIPWLMVGRSNGHLMHSITLRNQKTYSTKPNPDNPRWVHLDEEQYAQLIGDYWDNFAKHLDEKGVLDTAIFVIDESQPDTYETILHYVRAMRARPYSKQIKIGHTGYKTALYTYRKPDGKLLMDEVLDVPMPINDEHFNFFEPAWSDRYERPKEQWVYNVETDHMTLQDAGLSTVAMPLKLQQFGVTGWYCWESFVWSLEYAHKPGKFGGFKYRTGPVTNPWKNPFYHHGPGVLSYFYPPDPSGPAEQPNHTIIPSYRLNLMRDGIQTYALIDTLREKVGDEKVDAIAQTMSPLWADNPTQWYLSYTPYRESLRQLHDLAMQQSPEAVD